MPKGRCTRSVNALLLSPMGRRDWPLRFYSPALISSVEARRNFVPPDVAACHERLRPLERSATSRRLDRCEPAAAANRYLRQDGLPIPRRYWSAAAIWLALSMAVLDGSIANVALPTIAHDLGASAATSVWIVNAYQLTITVLLLPLAALGDRCGYRFIYIPGLALFTLGSVGCAFSDSLRR